MGFHYVPQAYLRGFSEPGNPGIVWQYDKEKRRFSRASVSKVAQQRGFYSPEVETQLSALVEGPANLALRKVRRKEMLEEKDRARLALYIGSMIKRVPRSRLKALELLPKAIEEAADEVKAQIEELARTKKVDESIVMATQEASGLCHPPLGVSRSCSDRESSGECSVPAGARAEREPS